MSELTVEQLKAWRDHAGKESFGEVMITKREKQISPHLDAILDLAIRALSEREREAGVENLLSVVRQIGQLAKRDMTAPMPMQAMICVNDANLIREIVWNTLNKHSTQQPAPPASDNGG